MPTFSELQQPEYLHVLLNHLPIHGLAIAVLGLALALAWRSRPAQVLALALVLINSAAAWPVYASGERGYKAVRGLADDDGVDFLDEHQERAEKTIWLFAVLAGLAAIAIAVPHWWPRAATPLAATTFLAAIGLVGVAGYIAYPGGKIRHPELRPTPPPVHSEAAANQPHAE